LELVVGCASREGGFISPTEAAAVAVLLRNAVAMVISGVVWLEENTLP
jgi:TRAP-type C4-dicarboxylate transport system permease large subunit